MVFTAFRQKNIPASARANIWRDPGPKSRADRIGSPDGASDMVVLRAERSMSKPQKNSQTYRGGCHCGRVAFEASGTIEDLEECNCSICAKKAYVHWFVPRESFHLLTPASDLATYRFNTRVAQHHFCPTCGVASFYIPRSDPDKIDVNVRCLEGVDLAKFRIKTFDGRNWEAALRERNRARRGKK